MLSRKVRTILLASTLLCQSVSASLQDLIDQGVFNELELEAAIAAQITYDRLVQEQGCMDSFLVDPISRDPTATCTGQVYLLFSNVREIIHTANDITNDGPIAFSLGSDVEGLGFALRWTAGEEYAAQGSMSSEFVGGQISSVATRLTALRAGASGFNVLGLGAHWEDDHGNLASNGRIRGAGASADSGYSRWGGFLNYDAGEGDRVATDLEDAFDFENSQVSLGFDYRYSDRWVFGLVVGLSDQEIDFDSSQSIVDGGIEASGTSIMPFAMYSKDAWYISTSLGWQSMSFETERSIRYPSFNPDLDSTDTVAVSDADASMLSLFLEGGYTVNWRAFAIEPYLNLKYSDISVDGFIEDDLNDDAFDLVVSGQDFSSQEFTLGTKLQYVLTPPFGVFIPYTTLEFVTQTDDAPRTVSAYYAQDSTGEDAFNVPTEALDSSYQVYTVGMSAILRGGRQKKLGGPVGGDLQAFVNYRTIEGLEGFTITAYSFGLRYTF